jgi:hypothetical protein
MKNKNETKNQRLNVFTLLEANSEITGSLAFSTEISFSVIKAINHLALRVITESPSIFL